MDPADYDWEAAALAAITAEEVQAAAYAAHAITYPEAEAALAEAEAAEAAYAVAFATADASHAAFVAGKTQWEVAKIELDKANRTMLVTRKVAEVALSINERAEERAISSTEARITAREAADASRIADAIDKEYHE
jgi:hypothetical protein